MKKKAIALLLTSMIITANIAPAAASDFSDGVAVEAGAEFGQPEVVSVEEAFVDAEEETSLFSDFVESQEEGVPIIEDNSGVEEAAAVEGEMYTITFEGELILDQTQEFVRLLNIEREKLGVPPVQIDQKMMEKAILRAPEVAVYYSHDMPTGENQDQVYGVSAECIGGKRSNKANDFINGFKSSPVHWGILTDRGCTRIGVAICRNGNVNYMSVCQVGVDWGAYEPYRGNYQNQRKIFTQKIKEEFLGDLYPQTFLVDSLYVGSTLKLKVDITNERGNNYFTLEGIFPHGVWKTLTPKTVSVDQNGVATGIASGEGIVRFYLKEGAREYSEFVFDVEKPVVVKPGTPKVTATVSGYKNVDLVWKKTSNTKGYQVYRYDNKTRKYQCIKTLKGSSFTTFTDALGYGKTAKYKVRAYNLDSTGKKTYGKFSSVKTVMTAPGTPSITMISNSSKGKLKLTWKKTSGAEGYVIYRKVGKSGSYKKVKTVTSGKTVSYTNGNLKKGTAYYYKMRAYRKGADGKNIYSKWSKVIGKTCK